MDKRAFGVFNFVGSCANIDVLCSGRGARANRGARHWLRVVSVRRTGRYALRTALGASGRGFESPSLRWT